MERSRVAASARTPTARPEGTAGAEFGAPSRSSTLSKESNDPVGPDTGVPGNKGAVSVSDQRRQRWENGLLVTLLTVVALTVRLHGLDKPGEVVFDEVHFGQHAAMYINHTYFFDVHPPLGKLLFAGVAYWQGFRGDFGFGSIGLSYPKHVPYHAMRMVSGVCGALLIPVAYLSLTGMGLTRTSALLAASLVLIDTAMVTQSRLILLDMPLLLAIAVTVCAWVRVRWHSVSGPPSPAQLALLLTTGCGLGLALSVKWVGLFVVSLVGFSTIRHLWALLGDRRISLSTWMLHFGARAVTLIAVPIGIYVGLFMFHLHLLHLPGPGNTFLPAPLRSALFNELHGPRLPADVAIDSLVQFRNAGSTESLLLHSHTLKYPHGSGEQQVTSTKTASDNSWWVIRARLPTSQGHGQGQALPVFLKERTLVRLEHKLTRRLLTAHANHPAPFTSNYYEVAVVNAPNSTDAASSLDSSTWWNLEIVREEAGYAGTPGLVHTWGTMLRLRHHDSGCLLSTSVDALLPDWASHQSEVACIPDTPAFVLSTPLEAQWVVDNHRHPRMPLDAVVAQRPAMPWWSTLWRMHELMWTTNEGLQGNHPYQSTPSQWPLLVRGIGYWRIDKAQIYFIGNPVIWTIALASVAVSPFLAVVGAAAAQRGYSLGSSYEAALLGRASPFLIGGWLLHYLPFFFMKRNLFLHHYLPALYFSLLSTGVLHDVMTRRLPPAIAVASAMAIFAWTGHFSAQLWPLAVGDVVAPEDCPAMNWYETWLLGCP